MSAEDERDAASDADGTGNADGGRNADETRERAADGTTGVASPGDGGRAGDEEGDADELAVQVDLLRSENRRLREEYARARLVRYRRTAIALALVGLVSIVGAAAFPIARTVLVVVGATGVFGGILTYYLTPERVVPASVGQSAYDALSRTGRAVGDGLGLSEISVYVPIDAGDDVLAPVRLFVPQSRSFEVPPDEELLSAFVAPESESMRGVSFVPAAARMLAEFDRAVVETGDDPEAAVAALSDALVEQFELVRRADYELDPDGGRAIVGVSGCAYGDVSSFDHPVASLVGAGLAHLLGEPVTVEVSTPEEGGSEYLLTCRW
ncbi:MAG: hypothetical protein ABEJ28_06225 [Salinigranum sp.]